MDKRTSLKMDKSNLKCNNCIECNSTIVLPNHQCSNYTQTRLDQIDNLDNYITEINNQTSSNLISPVKSTFTRHSSLRSSKSSQNIQRYQNDKLDYYQQLLLNNDNNYSQLSENQLYYSFLRLYVDCLTGYTDQEIWHFVNHHNPRIKQFNQGLIIRIPSDIWFIIVTGSVFINGKLYLPHSM